VNKKILNTDVQNFIFDNLNSNIHSLILRGSPFKQLDIKEITIQIQAKKKCELKLKTWYSASNIYYPNKLNIEQTSSESTAKIKSSLISGDSLVDLSGGFGVDSYYFSRQFKAVTHCEINAELAEIAAHNFSVLKADNIINKAMDGLEFLSSCNNTFDWIYIDPSRRDAKKRKKFLIEDCSPNIVELQNSIFKYSNNVLIKLSPMLDISSSLKTLKQIRNIYIIAVKNEVKELLFHQEKDFDSAPCIHTINSKSSETERFSFEMQSEKNAEATFGNLKTYLYEPNAAVLKSGAFKLISEQFNLEKLDLHTHLYTSELKSVDFPGKIYEISNVFPYHKKTLKQHIGGSKANVKTRNFPEKTDALKKQFKLSDGGDSFLFFTSCQKEKLLIQCKLA
tara:strand:+ start:24496 stop:25677 length:1182 start_codon:yes stop_codon:yes gene_type:complete